MYYEPSRTALLSNDAFVIHQLTSSEATQLVSSEPYMDVNAQNTYSTIDLYILRASYIPSGAGISGLLFYPLRLIRLPLTLRVEINGQQYSFLINRIIKEEN